MTLADFPAELFTKSKPAAFPRRETPSGLPKSANAQRLTTDIRFVLTADTVLRYSLTDIAAEKAELIAAGMWHQPNGGQPYTIRIRSFDIATLMISAGLMGESKYAEWIEDESPKVANPRFIDMTDFDFRNDALIGETRVTGLDLAGSKGLDKQWYVDSVHPAERELIDDLGLVPESRQAWWEKGNVFYLRYQTLTYLKGDGGAIRLSAMLRDILILALMDKSIAQEQSPRPERSSAFKPGGWLYNPELDVQEVTIRCPGSYRTERNERGEPTGRKVKMHRRRGHVRTYHRDMPNEIKTYIQPVWVNAVAGVMPPPVVYTLKGV